MINNSILKATLIAAALCTFTAPAFSATVLQFGKGSAVNGTVVAGTGVGNMDVGILTVNVDGNSSLYTFTTGNFLRFDFTALGTDAFALRTTGSLASNPVTPTISGGSGAPGATALNDASLGASVQLVTAVSNLNVLQNSANPANYSLTATVSLLNSFLSELGIASGTTFNVSGGWTGLSSTSLSSETVTFTATPEPSSVMLFATGLIGMGLLVWKRRKARA